MERWRNILLGIYLALATLGAAQPGFGQESGTLLFNLKNYASDVKLPKRSQKALEHGGLRWGILGNSILIPFVNENFVKADTPYFTRFGEQTTLEMKPGSYTITCIGYEFNSMSRDTDKNLAESVFFNNDVVAFTVLPGKTTTLEIYPIFRSESQSRFLSKFTMYIPDLKLRVLENGTPKGEDVVVNRRNPKFVPWNHYHGPLKF